MRNLKKILALVLALVMSLSLMATASAGSFPDVDAENPYATAIEVLDELKVFQGYKEDGTFRPTETLNRAQAAVLVYRIATGDVEDKYLDNYTYMQQSKFTDLDGYNWAKGYINYCQNAGIVVGTSSTTFEPGKQVTGYQLLVMLLRTLGYGKAGEFADPKGWELQTATIAERENITKNVTSGDFGAPAPRQMVAEILFRGLLTETVEYSALVPGGYTKSGETLGMREFGLEKVSGVVMANQWANLEGDKVLAVDTTVMKIDDKNVTLNKGTDLDAVGLNYNAYIANGEGSVKRALTLEEGDNVVAFNEGKGVNTDPANRSWASVEKLAEEEGLSIDTKTDKTQYFVNYDQAWDDIATSEYLIRYVVNEKVLNDAQAANYISQDNLDEYIEWLVDNATVSGTAPNRVWTRTIRPGKDITLNDQAIMREIFYAADREQDNEPGQPVSGWKLGEVYVGTTSTKDYSDTMSWRAFREEYFTTDKNYKKIDICELGNSLRIIDNNGDGMAEYVLKIEWTQDKAIGNYKSALLFNSGLKLADYDAEKNTLAQPDELAVGDIANWNIIDGKLTINKADKVTETVTVKSFKNITVTAGETYGQSGIKVRTSLQDNIMAMEDKVEYDMYLDEYGYIRSYELAQDSQYALLTEMYPTGNNQHNYVSTSGAIAEMVIRDADPEEYGVAGDVNNPFFSKYVWTIGGKGYFNSILYNYLQPAVAHLGRAKMTDAAYAALIGETNNTASYSIPTWKRDVANAIQTIPATVDDPAHIGVFDYGPFDNTVGTPITGGWTTVPGGVTAANTDSTFSFTNVAAYALNDDNEVTLKSASQFAFDTNGDQLYYYTKGLTQGGKAYNGYETKFTERTWSDSGVAKTFSAAVNDGDLVPVYAVDYVQLDKDDVFAGKVHYDINANYNGYYKANSNSYVDATVDTEFYIVEPDGVTYKTGYDELPRISSEKIRAAYAVATNTTKALNGLDYWVADVIVIEVNSLEYSYDSISLAYYNPYETTDYVRTVETLNNKWHTYQPDSEDQAMMEVVPKSVNGGGLGWGNSSWTGFGFYELYNVTNDADSHLEAGDIRVITQEWNDHGIYAGTFQRAIGILNSSGYIDVDKQGRPAATARDDSFAHIYVRDVPVYAVAGRYTTGNVDLLEEMNISDVQLGDRLIWVYDESYGSRGTSAGIAYIIDLDAHIDVNGSDYDAPSYLVDIYDGSEVGGIAPADSIIGEQIAGVTPEAKQTVVFDITLGTGEKATFLYDGKEVKTLEDTDTDKTVSFEIPHNADTFNFTVKTTTSVALAAIVPQDGTTWARAGSSVTDNGTERVYEIYMIKAGLKNAPSEGEAPAATAVDTIYTVKAVTEKIARAGELVTAIGVEATTELVAEANALIAELEAVQANLIPGDENTITSEALDEVVSESEAGSLAAALVDINEETAEAIEAVEGFITTAVGTYGEVPAVKEAVEALKTAMDACSTADEVNKKFLNAGEDGLNTENELVKDLLAKVAEAEKAGVEESEKAYLKECIASAKEALTEAAAGYEKYSAVSSLITQYTGLLDKCDVVVGAADAPTAVSTYWTEANGLAEGIADEFTAAVANAKATELAGLKKDAAAAVDALVKGYECEAVNNAATTLKGKINDCQVGSTGATLITTYYTDGKLVADQTEVEAVIEAVLDQAKVLAGEAVADLVDGLNLDEPENEAVKEAKEALESKIEACDALTGEAEAETALSTYWVLSTGLVEDQTEVKALVDAIEALTPATPDAP